MVDNELAAGTMQVDEEPKGIHQVSSIDSTTRTLIKSTLQEDANMGEGSQASLVSFIGSDATAVIMTQS